MPTDRLAKELVKKSLEFHLSKVWRHIAGEAVFLVKTEFYEELIAVAVLESDETEAGLACLRSGDSLEDMRGVLMHSPDLLSALDCDECMLGLTFAPYGDLAPKLRKVLDASGIAFRRSALAPAFISRSAGVEKTRQPNKTDQKVLLSILNALKTVSSDENVHIGSAFESEVLLLTLEGSPYKPEITPKVSEAPAAAFPKSQFGEFSDQLEMGWGWQVSELSELLEDLVELERGNSAVEIGVVQVPGELIGRQTAADCLVAYDVEQDHACGMIPVQTVRIEKIPHWIIDSLLHDDADGEVRCPSKLIVSDTGIYDVLRQNLPESVLPVELASTLPALTQFADRLTEAADGMVDHDDGASTPELRKRRLEIGDSCVELSGLLAVELVKSRRRDNKLELAFFGAPIRSFADTPEAAEGALIGMSQWAVSFYRPQPRSKTIVEQLIKSPTISKLHRVILRQMSEEPLRFFRVVDVDPGQTVTLQHYGGENEVCVFDRSLSESVSVGGFLCAQVQHVEGFAYVSAISPFIPEWIIDRLLEALEGEGLEIDDEGAIVKGVDLVGRMWPLLFNDLSKPELRNMDGDIISESTADFQIDDMEGLLKSLDEAGIVVCEAVGRKYVFLGKNKGIGEVVLGHVEIENGMLRLQANSRARFVMLTDWLNELGSLTLVRMDS